MAEDRDLVPPRVPTRIPGLDDVLGGGLFRGGVYLVMGLPGSGKTILANQLAFEHARAGGRVVYATLLAEAHGRLLAFMRTMSFFDPALVGDAITYVSGHDSMEQEGLTGLLQLVRTAVRDRRASLLVLDGMTAATSVAPSDVEHKKFVQQLQTWIEVVGCTVVLLTSARAPDLRPELTMVDGILELEHARAGARRVRELTIAKLRGSAYREGLHSYEISGDGFTVYPRIEATVGAAQRRNAAATDRAPFGLPALDAALDGGLARASSTLVLGATGSGKTTFGAQFLAAGLAEGERVVHAGFYEDPVATASTGDRLGFRFSDRLARGELGLVWHPATEVRIDPLGHEILATVRRLRAQRLVFDGIEALLRATHPERLPGFFYAIVQELRALGVTSIVMSETQELAATQVELPFPGVSGIVDNLVFLRHAERGGRLVRELVVHKTRARAHESAAVEFDIDAGGLRVGTPARAKARAKGRGARGASGGRGARRRGGGKT